MKISTQTRYALRFLLELSLRTRPPLCITTRSIAQRQGISEKYLESIAAKLRKAGYVKSVKGAGGGYILHKDAESITVGAIMRLMETTFFQIHSTHSAPVNSEVHNDCVIVSLYERIEEQIISVVDHVTLADLRADFNARLGNAEQKAADC